MLIPQIQQTSLQVSYIFLDFALVLGEEFFFSTSYWRIAESFDLVEGVDIMSDNQKLRKRFFVDPKVQGALVYRVILYWVVCLVSITLMLLSWRLITGPARMFYTHLNEMWFFYGPAAIASCILLPLVIIDVIRFSNRFVGPLIRLRRSLRALARGQEVEPIEFRTGDFWQEFADEFNAVATQMKSLRKKQANSESHDEESFGDYSLTS